MDSTAPAPDHGHWVEEARHVPAQEPLVVDVGEVLRLTAGRTSTGTFRRTAKVSIVMDEAWVLFLYLRQQVQDAQPLQEAPSAFGSAFEVTTRAFPLGFVFVQVKLF